MIAAKDPSSQTGQNAKYIRYTPSTQGPEFNSGARYIFLFLFALHIRNTLSTQVNFETSLLFIIFSLSYFTFFSNSLSQRIVRLVEMPKDPLEPPKFKYQKAPPVPGSPPVPVLHSPPKKLTKGMDRYLKRFNNICVLIIIR